MDLSLMALLLSLSLCPTARAAEAPHPAPPGPVQVTGRVADCGMGHCWANGTITVSCQTRNGRGGPTECTLTPAAEPKFDSAVSR